MSPIIKFLPKEGLLATVADKVFNLVDIADKTTTPEEDAFKARVAFKTLVKVGAPILTALKVFKVSPAIRFLLNVATPDEEADKVLNKDTTLPSKELPVTITESVLKNEDVLSKLVTTRLVKDKVRLEVRSLDKEDEDTAMPINDLVTVNALDNETEVPAEAIRV